LTLADPRARVEAAFAEAFGGTPALIARAPGRVNLIGEHTDYNDGFVLPMAIGGQTLVAARARADDEIRVVAADLGRTTSFHLSDITPSEEEPWSNYVRGVAAALQAQGLAVKGAGIAIAGDVPQGAGLSSSASLEVATGLALAALAGQPDYDRTQIALAGQRAEHDFAGCQCGIMDQLVSARAVVGHALLIDCRSLEAMPVPLPHDWAVMIVHSGVSRGLVDGEYNARRAQCEAAARHYGVRALRDVDVASPEGLDPATFRRARHVVTENARTMAAVDALKAGDLRRLGKLMAASHASMRDDFEITVPQVDHLVAILQDAIGSEGGARMTGGGFGGAVVAIMRNEAVEAVKAAVEAPHQSPLIRIECAAPGCALL
jgi:galactokinase